MTAPALTDAAVLDILRDVVGNQIDTLDRLRPGAWSSAWGFEDGGAAFVARFSHVADDFERDAFAHRFSAPSLPVPRVIHRGIVDDVHVCISERVQGQFLDDLDGSAMTRTLPALLETLDALRTADTSGSSGYGGWDAAGNGAFPTWQDALRAGLQDRPDDRNAGWRAILEASPSGASAFDRDLALFERFLDVLPAHRHVIHADLINDNCFVNDEQITGVIDWGCAMYGDHLYDIAWFEFWSPWYPQWREVRITESAMTFFRDRGADMVNADERLACYLLHIGLGHQAYNASIGDMAALDDVIRRTTEIAHKVC